MITIDGATGEGGGQILRSALTLSAATGQPFQIKKIRAKRKKPGLMRQHLTCVNAIAEICGAHVDGASIGSTELIFTPGDIRSGAYHFRVGTAGSSLLVFQTVLPVLVMADTPSTVRFEGGTHTLNAPSFETIDESFLPTLRAMGIAVETRLEKRGFYPAGGGRWQAEITPSDTVKPLELTDRGAATSVTAEAMISNLSGKIAEREVAAFREELNLTDDQAFIRTYNTSGPGNCCVVRLGFENTQEVFTGYGHLKISAEGVAKNLSHEVRHFLKRDAAVGPYKADQLLLPLALGAGGRFTTPQPTPHFETNCDTIKAFLDVSISSRQIRDGLWDVDVRRQP